MRHYFLPLFEMVSRTATHPAFPVSATFLGFSSNAAWHYLNAPERNEFYQQHQKTLSTFGRPG